MIMNIMNFLSNIDKNSQFLLIMIGILSFLLFLTFVINHFSYKKTQRILKKQQEYKRKLIEEIDNEAKNINTNIKASSIPVKEDIEVLDDDEVLEVFDDLKEDNVITNINLNEYEKEEENSAIISYDELCKKFNVEKKVYTTKEKEVIKTVTNIVENTEHKFKPSTYVSPIFGKEEKQDQTFLQNLKEFRNGLE